MPHQHSAACRILLLTACFFLQAEFGDLYSADNVAITATHTHASPGGVLGHMLYHITSLGFVRQSFDAMVDGIVEVREV
jgi:neutral ceramidase